MSNESSFLEAFRVMNTAADRHTCACGHEYYYPEAVNAADRAVLDAAENATSLEHCIWFVRFGSKLYVENCTCWHEQARRVIAFMDEYALQIACYQGQERIRKLEQTNADI